MNKNLDKKGRVIILTYYWPPSGGSGVQRWMYFSKYLREIGWEPLIITVHQKKASYPVLDTSLYKVVKDIKVLKTSTNEPLKLFSFLTTGGFRRGIPQGEVKNKGLFNQLSTSRSSKYSCKQSVNFLYCFFSSKFFKIHFLRFFA